MQAQDQHTNLVDLVRKGETAEKWNLEGLQQHLGKQIYLQI